MKFQLLAFFALIQVLSSQAQIINIESQRIQNDSVLRIANLEANFSSQLNNQRTLLDGHLGGLLQFKSRDTKNMLLILVNGDRSIANGLDLSNSNLIHVRFSHKIDSKIKIESFYQAQNNRMLDLNNRQLLGSGLRFKLTRSKKFNYYLGTLYMYELEQTLDRPQTTGYNRLSCYFSCSIKPNKSKIEFTNVVYYQPLITSITDFRLSEQMNLSIPISDRIVFISNVMCYLDKRPPADVAPYTYLINHGFRFSFI